jgi:hypothetical protein
MIDPNKRYDILDEMPFGKYKGILIGTVIEDDPSYMQWAVRAIDDFRLHEEASKYLTECSE